MDTRVAVIDIGSNSSRLNVYELCDDGGFKELGFKRIPTALAGRVVAGNTLDSRGIELACASVTELSDIARREYQASEQHVFATASLRGRSNEQQVIVAIKERCGADVCVLDGMEEAACGFASLAHRYKPACAVMADVGGGSTELVVAEGGSIVFMRSLDLGSRTLSARFVADAWPTAQEVDAMRRYIEEQLSCCATLKLSQQPVLFGIGGTARALAGIAAGDKRLFDAGLRDAVEQACPQRLDTMAAGALILQGVFDVFKPCKFIASDANPREGYLIRHILGHRNLPPTC